VNKDRFYKALHEPANQELLMQFASEKNQRALLISRIDQRGKAFNEDDDQKDEAVASGSPK
jgi:hypothetical protein